MNKLTKFAAGTGLVVVGIAGYKGYQSMPECLKESDAASEIAHCALNGMLDFKPTPSRISIGGLEVASKSVVNDMSFKTFGEVDMELRGHATVDYDTENLANWMPGVDATWFYNKGEKNTSKVTMNPCVQLSGDYKKDNASTLSYTLVPDKNGGVAKVEVADLKVAPCFVRYDATDKNPMLWQPNGHSDEKIDYTVQNTMRAQIAKVFQAYAEANACPQDVVNIPALKRSVAAEILGNISVNEPNAHSQVRDLYNESLKTGFGPGSTFEISLQDAFRQNADGQRKFSEVIQEVTGVNKSFPVPGQKHTVKMKNVEIGGLSVAVCNAASPITIQGNN